jgi:hypothetical protein
VNIAKGSIGELFDSTDEALEKGYLDSTEHGVFNQLIDEAMGTSVELHRYLISTPDA